MSKLFDAFKTPEEDWTPSWFLKASDNTVYGPVNISTLAGWAMQNRVAPGNMVSNNQKDWLPVETLPELEMSWFVQLQSGRTYGPINRMATPYLVRQGILDKASSLKNKATGNEVLVQAILEAETRQLAMEEVLETTEAYRHPQDKPSFEQSPEKDETCEPEREPIMAEKEDVPVSQMALKLSEHVESRTGMSPILRTSPLSYSRKAQIISKLTGKDTAINKRLIRKVRQLHEQLMAERERVQKLQKEWLGRSVNMEPTV